MNQQLLLVDEDIGTELTLVVAHVVEGLVGTVEDVDVELLLAGEGPPAPGADPVGHGVPLLAVLARRHWYLADLARLDVDQLGVFFLQMYVHFDELAETLEAGLAEQPVALDEVQVGVLVLGRLVLLISVLQELVTLGEPGITALAGKLEHVPVGLLDVIPDERGARELLVAVVAGVHSSSSLWSFALSRNSSRFFFVRIVVEDQVDFRPQKLFVEHFPIAHAFVPFMPFLVILRLSVML